jgi:hypothetical protein
MDDLIKAYLDTDFNVYEPTITIKCGKLNPALDNLLKTNNSNDWAYITAWNPYSELTDVAENEERNYSLKQDLNKYKIFDGEGVGIDPNWQPEKSFLIFDINHDDAIAIGKKYCQNAIVIGKLNEVAELIWIK